MAAAQKLAARFYTDEELEGDRLYVRLKGACAGCPRAPLALKNVVEALVRRRFPAIREVRNLY